MRGLVAYDEDSQSDTEIIPPPNAQRISNEKQTKTGSKSASEGRSIKSQVIIKKPSTHLRSHQPRAHVGQELDSEPSTSHRAKSIQRTDDEGTVNSTTSGAGPSTPRSQQDELSSLRAALKPPPIPGLDDWGIPPESKEAVNPTLEAKLKQFSELKANPENPRHFNDSLMSNRSFRNPHLYTKLVEFVDVDERTTNFPREIWDPSDVKAEWFADQIADAQRERSEKQAANQSSGKRSRIDFASSSRTGHSASVGSSTKGKDVFGTHGSMPSYSHGPAPKRSRLQIPAGGSISSSHSHIGGHHASGRPSRWGPA
ncbi:hypothetical protein CVT24_007635 [Panaeolus cyanescens]|uniref:HCNGP-domain-containing protein n=1 Tax=Panaeolus cyanescens TaxID=181874 RepID=A0A409W548_9AGAR|nr:hypothetical protein CVT24_007635 [Panaeolus cyanescens]